MVENQLSPACRNVEPVVEKQQTKLSVQVLHITILELQ